VNLTLRKIKPTVFITGKHILLKAFEFQIHIFFIVNIYSVKKFADIGAFLVFSVLFYVFCHIFEYPGDIFYENLLFFIKIDHS